MATWGENIVEEEVERYELVGVHVPVQNRNGKLPYCIYHKARNNDGTVRNGIRCGVNQWLCENCGNASGECFPRRQNRRR